MEELLKPALHFIWMGGSVGGFTAYSHTSKRNAERLFRYAWSI